jgi:AcrR family transcriptional regulator
MNKSRGRPRGNPPTKAQIADAARELFLERGYRGTTVRAVAARAGVDSALISYHFGSKRGLFGEALLLRCNLSLAISDALPGDPAGLADRLLRAVTDQWDGDAELSALNQMALREEEVLRLFREYLDREVLARIAEFLGGPDATARATAVVALLGGLIFTRYLVPLPTTAAYTAADIRRILGPSLRVALAGRVAIRPAARVPAESRTA